MLQLIECPRDAMQGLHEFIPTEDKIRYLNMLFRVGFHSLDMGSFVSAKAIPQMSDTAEVMKGIDLEGVETKLLVIVANVRGAEEAVKFPAISYLGFPLSLSETFQQRNTNKSVEEAFTSVKQIQELCVQHEKALVVYLSMGFGNPYGDLYDPSYVIDFTKRLYDMGVRIVSLADTVGAAEPAVITPLFEKLIPAYPDVTFGAHFHSRADNMISKIAAAYDAGCRRFDGALKGLGGCPMASDDLTGNTATEAMIAYFENKGLPLNIDEKQLMACLAEAARIFPQH